MVFLLQNFNLYKITFIITSNDFFFLALPKQGLKKFTEHSDLFLSTEIFSKRQKIYLI